MENTETQSALLQFAIYDNPQVHNLEVLEKADARHARDLVVNMQNIFACEHINPKEAALTAIAVAANNRDIALQKGLEAKAVAEGATAEEIAEAIACASMLAANNVLYRFRHFTGKEKYTTLQARIRMNTMSKPVLGKELFELISLAVSAVNGCEMCVNAHEQSVLHLGATEERVFDAIRIASVVTSAGKVLHD